MSDHEKYLERARQHKLMEECVTSEAAKESFRRKPYTTEQIELKKPVIRSSEK